VQDYFTIYLSVGDISTLVSSTILLIVSDISKKAMYTAKMALSALSSSTPPVVALGPTTPDFAFNFFQDSTIFSYPSINLLMKSISEYYMSASTP
jgi:hypothetical protein